MANDKSKTKAQLIAELEEMRQQRSVEKAAERIREEVLAMRHSDDISKVVALMWREMVGLGIETPCGTILFINESTERIIMYEAWENPKHYQYITRS